MLPKWSQNCSKNGPLGRLVALLAPVWPSLRLMGAFGDHFDQKLTFFGSKSVSNRPKMRPRTTQRPPKTHPRAPLHYSQLFKIHIFAKENRRNHCLSKPYSQSVSCSKLNLLPRKMERLSHLCPCRIESCSVLCCLQVCFVVLQ